MSNKLFEPTPSQQEFILNNKDKINQLAAKIWESVNEIDPDPSHPNFDYFDDPIKYDYIQAASFILLVNEKVCNEK